MYELLIVIHEMHSVKSVPIFFDVVSQLMLCRFVEDQSNWQAKQALTAITYHKSESSQVRSGDQKNNRVVQNHAGGCRAAKSAGHSGSSQIQQIQGEILLRSQSSQGPALAQAAAAAAAGIAAGAARPENGQPVCSSCVLRCGQQPATGGVRTDAR